MGLLVRRQAGRHRHHRPLRQADGEGRQRPRRRRLLGPHGQHRRVELGDGRGPLPDAALERVHHVMTILSGTLRALPLIGRFRRPAMAAAVVDRVMAAGQPARLRADRAVRVADDPVRGRQLLGLRPHRHLSGLHARQLPRPADHAGDDPGLCQLADVRGHRVGDHAVSRLQHRPFPDLSRAQRGGAHGRFSCCARSRSGRPASSARSPGSRFSAATAPSTRC